MRSRHELRGGGSNDLASTARLAIVTRQEALIEEACRPVGRLVEAHQPHRVSIPVQGEPGGRPHDVVLGDHKRSILRGPTARPRAIEEAPSSLPVPTFKPRLAASPPLISSTAVTGDGLHFFRLRTASLPGETSVTPLRS